MDLVPREYKQKESISLGQAVKKPEVLVNKIKDKMTTFWDAFLKVGIIAGFILILVFLGAWQGMRFYEKSLLAKIEAVKAEEGKIFSANDKAVAANIIDLNKSASLLQALLKSHVYTSAFFDKLASVTLPEVRWTAVDLATKDLSVDLKGKTPNYSVLARQLIALDQAGFTNLKIGSVAMDKGGMISFQIVFNFEKRLLENN